MADDPPIRNRTFQLADTSENDDIWRSLIDAEAATFASRLWHRNLRRDPIRFVGAFAALAMNDSRRDAQLESPPEDYVVRYYLAMPGSAPPDQVMETMRSNNAQANAEENSDQQSAIPIPERLVPINDLMHRSIVDAFSTIESQLPERFRYERTMDPQDADIVFAAVPDIRNETEVIHGGASLATGAVILNDRSFREIDTVMARSVALHEILHAMGLRHPQDARTDGGVTNERASYFDTVMTYSDNNSASPMRSAAHPISMMPADIRAMLVLCASVRTRPRRNRKHAGHVLMRTLSVLRPWIGWEHIQLSTSLLILYPRWPRHDSSSRWSKVRLMYLQVLVDHPSLRFVVQMCRWKSQKSIPACVA